MVEFTSVLAVDAAHEAQLRAVWPNWIGAKPELAAAPLLVICDAFDGGARFWRRRLSWLDHSSRNLVYWDWPNSDDTEFSGITQRERMLTAFVKVPWVHVQTPYWLKIDTDAVATATGPWIQPEWFQGNPAIVASPWGYTKPAYWIDALESWGNAHEAFYHLPKLGLATTPDARTFRHKRFASWICFVDTLWSRYAAGLCPSRLPVPSQDTFHWYVATRRNDLIRRVSFKRHGWTNVAGTRRRQKLIESLSTPSRSHSLAKG